MANAEGFWSYVHADDEAEGGRIARLARDVVAQYQMTRGETITLFLDLDSIEWGDRWRPTVDASLSSVAFFIAVITPRYFQSAECRRELNFFARRAINLGIRELVLPILYVDVPSFHDDTTSDDAVALVRSFQWVDWRELRFAATDSADHRQAVSRLAVRLAEANDAAERSEMIPASTLSELESDDDQLGTLDLMARMEEVMPRWVENLNAIAAGIQSITSIITVATEDVTRSDQHGQHLAARLVVARELSRDLEEPVQRIHDLGNEFASYLNQVDEGMRVIIEQAPREVGEGLASREDVCTFFGTTRMLTSSAEEGLGSLSGMVDAISPAERMSRDLRPVLRKLRQGLTLMLEGREVMREWVRLIDSSGLQCEERATS